MAHPWPMGHHLESESDPASLSPRTALLSPPFGDDTDADGDGVGTPRRSSRGPGIKFRHARERAHSTASARDLLRLLVDEEYESQQTRRMLYTAFERLEQESRRAEAAEARIDETVQRARAINDARVAAQEQAVRAQEELKLYKLQLDNAQKEILRAQDVLKAIELQRDEAEAAAVSARSKARRLNEERLIELAREEGRRLGFEEGVRRGRRMGYREAYSAGVDGRRNEMQEVATDVVNRLLEDRDEPEHIEVLAEPTPVPPPRMAPELHRMETQSHSPLHNPRPSSRGRRDSTSTIRQAPGTVNTPTVIIPPRTTSTPTASQTSRPRSASQPWPGHSERSYAPPISIQNSPPSVRYADFHIPPDNFIPTLDENHNIILPPPHEMQRNIPSPTPSQMQRNVPSPTPSQRTLGQSSERGRRDYVYDNYVPPRRSSPDESLASTKQSAASEISQLDIVGLPASSRRRDRPPSLSVIHEDVSMRSERMTDSQTIASEARRNSSRERGSSETLRQRDAKQRFADELRYSDPSAAQQWRQDNRPQQPPDGPPRHRPPHITVPTPLSPVHRRTPSERQGRSEMRGDYRDQRRLSSESSVPEISVVPPSRSPSDAPSRGGNAYGLLSPDHAHQPLPIPAPSAPVSNSRSSPVPGSPRRRRADLGDEIYTVLPDGQLPLGFLPSPATNRPQTPVIPQTTGGASQRYTVPPGAVPRAPSSTDRETTRSRSPISFYAPAPVPNNVTYPAPPISRSATFTAGSTSNPSVTSEGRRRRDSLGATAGMTPATRSRPIPTAGSDGGTRELRGRRPSNASLGSQTRGPSFGRYVPEGYNDPAYLASNDSLVDSMTDANTAANGRVRSHSPAYSFATLRTNE